MSCTLSLLFGHHHVFVVNKLRQERDNVLAAVRRLKARVARKVQRPQRRELAQVQDLGDGLYKLV